MDAATQELLKQGILGALVVLIVGASFGGAIIWLPSFRLIVAAKDDRIAELKTRLDEAMAGWRSQTEATNRLAGAIEARNDLDRQRVTDPRSDRRGR